VNSWRAQRIVAVGVWVFVLGNLGAIVAIWAGGGADGIGYRWHSVTQALLGSGRLAALLAGFLALIQVLLLARLPFIERLAGFDRLTVWHRWNGQAVFYLIIGHVGLSVWGYARTDHLSVFREYWNWLTLPQPTSLTHSSQAGTIGGSIAGSIGGGGSAGAQVATSPYPGIITATVGTALIVVVVVSSLVIVRRRLSYEWWYAIHVTAYAGIALSWFHMIPDGNEFVLDHIAADYWRVLYGAALALVLVFRVARPLRRFFMFDLRVTEVVDAGAGVVSLTIAGRGLERFRARPGQFFLWRFLSPGLWYTHHPFSLSEVPTGDTFRITVKQLGDHTDRIAHLPVGTRVFAEGPFGAFTERVRRSDRAVLIAGGIGITPVRALMEQMRGDLVVVYRIVSDREIVFRDELDRIAADRGIRLRYVVGDHASAQGRELLSVGHLNALVPDITERDVYLCGPPGMVESILDRLRAIGVPRRQLHVERFAL